MDFHSDYASTFASGEDDVAVPIADPADNRLQIRAYNHWARLLNGRAVPSIDDLDLDSIDLGPSSFLLDLTCGVEDPAITYVGRRLREECRVGHDTQYVSDVPRGSLLSRLTDHYLQAVANASPVGFEAEFVDDKGAALKYRGILMPFSSNGDTIDFVCGSISWKEAGCDDAAPDEGKRVLEAVLTPQDEIALPRTLHQDPSLADRLALARQEAAAADQADVRSRSALYRALGQAYDFALAAGASPSAYRGLLEASGVKVQARAPMTPVVKLIFGTDYDKTRLTEYASALAYGRRHALPAGVFADYLEEFDGGLKALVRAERQYRRRANGSEGRDGGHPALERLRAASPLGFVNLDWPGEEFVLLVARRETSGALALVAPVKANEAFLERAIRQAVFKS